MFRMTFGKMFRAPVVMLVPTMLRLLLDHPAAAEVDMSSVRVIHTGTAPLPYASVTRSTELCPHVQIRNAHAMSEGGFHTLATTAEQLAKPGCVGRLVPNMQIRNAAGNLAPVGVVGEIYGKAGGKPRRYWRDEAASRATRVDGWTKSGDLGYLNEDGDLILTGRSKDLIIRGGFNIAPMEVDDVLHRHPTVRIAAVLAVEHEVLGEDVAAAVTLATGGTATPAELESWCRRHLADNKVPRAIVLLDELPVNQNAKITKGPLRPILQEAADRARAERHGG